MRHRGSNHLDTRVSKVRSKPVSSHLLYKRVSKNRQSVSLVPSVVVLQTTAGWRKAPALAPRVCTRGLASLRSISPKNTMNTTRFRVVRAAGA